MPEGNRWRNWRPPAKKSDELIGSELTKPTEMGFVGFVSSNSTLAGCSCSLIECDHAACREEFHRWMLGRCTYKGRRFGRVEELYCDFHDWCIDLKEIPCTPPAFVALLSEAGFFFANGLVSGIVLREDLPIRRDTQKSRRNAKAQTSEDAPTSRPA
jgi:hypothetical protein